MCLEAAVLHQPRVPGGVGCLTSSLIVQNPISSVIPTEPPYRASLTRLPHWSLSLLYFSTPAAASCRKSVYPEVIQSSPSIPSSQPSNPLEYSQTLPKGSNSFPHTLSLIFGYLYPCSWLYILSFPFPPKLSHIHSRPSSIHAAVPFFSA